MDVIRMILSTRITFFFLNRIVLDKVRYFEGKMILLNGGFNLIGIE
jgi:hypothetical protein